VKKKCGASIGIKFKSILTMNKIICVYKVIYNISMHIITYRGEGAHG